MASERLDVILSLITGNYKREAREAATATGQISSKAKETGGAVTGMADKVNAARGKLLLIAAAAGTLGAAFGSAIRAASDLGESINAVEKVFGEASGIIANFGEVSANAVGLSTREFNQLATVTGSMLQNLGLNEQEAARQTVTLTQRASDMASVFNTDVGTALGAINSALKGEANPIEQFGVKLNDAAVRARAVELGLAKTTAEVDANAKAVATLNIIYEQTSQTQGDFASTSDDLANSQRRAAAAFENAQARLGKSLTPLAGNLVNRFAEGVERIAAAFGDAGARKSIVFNEAIVGINKEMEAGTLDTNDLADALRHLAENSDLTASDFETLAAMVGLSADQFGIFSESVIAEAEAMGLPAQVVEELRLAMEGLGPAADSTIDPLAGSAEGAEAVYVHHRNAAQAVAEHLAAQIALADELVADLNPVTNAVSAWQKMRTAQDDATEAVKKFGPESIEAADALLNQAVATAEAEAALLRLGDGNLERGIQAIATALGITYNEANDLLGVLLGFDGRTFTSTVIVKQITQTQLVNLPTKNINTGVVGYQHGGAYSAFRPMIVGEAGPEMLVPSSGGTVLSNPDTRRLLAAMKGSGGDWNINLNGVHTVDRGAIDLLGTMAGVQRRVESRR